MSTQVTPELVQQLLDSDFPEVDLHPFAPLIAAAYLELAAAVTQIEAAIVDANRNSHRMVSTRRLDEVLEAAVGWPR